MVFIGETAALFTSLCWTLSALGFTRATLQFGSLVTNRVRLLLALLALVLINAVLYAQPIPLHAGAARWGWLAVSGIIGLVLGDTFLFLAYGEIGARLGLLLLSLSPVFGTAIAWAFLGQALGWMEVSGILLALGGISWVVLVRPDPSDTTTHRVTWRGILYGCLAALGQAVGLVFSQLGMTGTFSPFAGTLIRMLAAAVALWGVAFFQRQAGTTLSRVRSHPSALGWTSFGALFGPVLGVSASLLAVQNTSIGVASTLMALPPIFMLPVSWLVFKERFGWQAVAGTLLAIAGVALIFLS